MISDELVVDDPAGFGVPQGWNGHPRRAGRIGDRVKLMQEAHPPVGARHDVAGFAERPALAARLLERVGQGHERLKFLQRAHQRRAMRPRAGDRTIQVIAAGFGRKRGAGVTADTVAENRVALEIQPLVVVVEQDVLGPPLSVDKLSHSLSPAAAALSCMLSHMKHERQHTLRTVLWVTPCLGVVMTFAAAQSPAKAQDVRGMQICTVEKQMERRTSCLQANVEFLQARDAQAQP